MTNQTISREYLIEKLRHYGAGFPDCEAIFAGQAYMRRGADMLEADQGRENRLRGVVTWLVHFADMQRPGDDAAKEFDALITRARAVIEQDQEAETSVTAPTQGQESTAGFDLVTHLHRQRDFSERTFGPGARTAGVIDHIRKELVEVEMAPDDVTEWVDVVLLALDGAWRSGHSPEQIAAAIAAKQAKNEARNWPDWRTAEPGKAICHIKKGGAV